MGFIRLFIAVMMGRGPSVMMAKEVAGILCNFRVMLRYAQWKHRAYLLHNGHYQMINDVDMRVCEIASKASVGGVAADVAHEQIQDAFQAIDEPEAIFMAL